MNGVPPRSGTAPSVRKWTSSTSDGQSSRASSAWTRVLGVPHAGSYRKLLDSDALAWGGTGYNKQEQAIATAQPWAGRRARLQLDLPPFSALYFQRVTDGSPPAAGGDEGD